MPKIKCASIECKHNNDSGYCRYQGVVLLSDCYYHTVNDGQQHFHRCKCYEMSEESKKLYESLEKFYSEKMNVR